MESFITSQKSQITNKESYNPNDYDLGILEERVLRGIKHSRLATYNPLTQSKIERYHDSLNNITPVDMYGGKARKILTMRDRIRRETMKIRRYYSLNQYVMTKESICND